MDPLNTILIALGTGATIKAATTTTNEKVKDLYQILRDHIQRRFKEKQIDDMVLMDYEVAPKIWRSELKEDLKLAGVAEDQDIVYYAQELLKRVEPEQPYDTKVSGTVQGYNQGSYQQVIMNFGSESKAQEQKSGK
ncbi:MAG TPA: hypothetical protein VEH81_05275 [Ktedonobacteraceae bacterium]|nr:hypothetical protein [Ktedonobacteraceae bacterium]